MKKKRVFGFGLGGLVVIGFAIIVVGSGFNGCSSFSITQEEAAIRFARQGQKAPDFIFQETNPGRIHFASVGEGTDTIVFVHGSPGSWSAFSRFLMDEDLKKAGRLISVDRPGFGLSEPKTPERSLREQSRRIAEALQKEGVVDNAILIGHSLGGPVIVRMAADYPELVKGLVLVAPSMDPEIQKRQWYNYAAKFPPVKWGLSKDWVHSNEEIYPLENELKWLAEPLPCIKTPTIVIQGMEDELVPPGNADYVEEALKSAQRLDIRRIDGLNHFVPWRRPDLIKDAILDLQAWDFDAK